MLLVLPICRSQIAASLLIGPTISIDSLFGWIDPVSSLSARDLLDVIAVLPYHQMASSSRLAKLTRRRVAFGYWEKRPLEFHFRSVMRAQPTMVARGKGDFIGVHSRGRGLDEETRLRFWS